MPIRKSFYSGGGAGKTKQRRHLQHLAGGIQVHQQLEVADTESAALDKAGKIGLNQQAGCDFRVDLRLERVDVYLLRGFHRRRPYALKRPGPDGTAPPSAHTTLRMYMVVPPFALAAEPISFKIS